MKFLFLLALVAMSFSCIAQKYQYTPSPFFGHVDRHTLRANVNYKTIDGRMTASLTIDSSTMTQSTIRLMAVAGYAPGKQLVTGAGPSWQLLKYDIVSGTWETVFGAGILFWAGGSVAPGPQSPAFAVGPSIQIPILQSFSAPFAVGYIYDITNTKWMPVISINYSWK